MIRRPFLSTIVSAAADDTARRSKAEIEMIRCTRQFYQPAVRGSPGSLLADALSCTFVLMRNAAQTQWLRARCTVSLACLLCIGAPAFVPKSLARQTAAPNPPSVVTQSAAADPHALYQALNALRADAAHVYTVEELNLRRDIINLRLLDGKLAFLQALDGRITGAVFTGHGHIFATPRDR